MAGLLAIFLALAWIGGRQRRSTRAMAATDARLREAMTAAARHLEEREDLEDRLAHEAAHDALTGLANRSSLLAELDRAMSDSRRSGIGYGVLFIDVDRFKAVNDTLGHAGGDTLLRHVAESLRGVAGTSDVVARNGGDEFVVVSEAADMTELVHLAERIVSRVSRPVPVGDDHLRVTVSVGAVRSAPGSGAGDRLRDAELAMHEAKAAGGGRVRVFDEAMRQWADQRLDLEGALRRAVDRDELGVHIQPIIDLRTGSVTGGELLCRWTTEDGLEIPPTDFITLAEDSTLVVDIGRFMLDRACELLDTWSRDRRFDALELSVNISARHIDDPDVVDDVASALHRWDVSADRLHVELTETGLLEDLGKAAARLRSLRALGVGVTVDDFGVGHASLRYLRELPVGRVKIDRSIVTGFDVVDSDTVIVTMLSRLADVMDMDVVAEGIETEQQRERLSRAGCQLAQGHLFGAAMPTPAFDAWVASWDRERTRPARRDRYSVG